MRNLDFKRLKQRLDSLAEQVAAGDSVQIRLEARRLAEDLEEYGGAIHPGSITCREIGAYIREAKGSAEDPEMAAEQVRLAREIFENSELWPTD
jgi:hypothetical protein